MKKLSRKPEISPMYEADNERRKNEHFEAVYDNENLFTVRHKLVLLTFALSLVMIVVGVISLGWYIEEISAAFLLWE